MQNNYGTFDILPKGINKNSVARLYGGLFYLGGVADA